MRLERFPLIGATTRFGLLTPPLRARFGLVERLPYYPPDDLVQIITRSPGILGVDAAAPGAPRDPGPPRGQPPHHQRQPNRGSPDTTVRPRARHPPRRA